MCNCMATPTHHFHFIFIVRATFCLRFLFQRTSHFLFSFGRFIHGDERLRRDSSGSVYVYSSTSAPQLAETYNFMGAVK